MSYAVEISLRVEDQIKQTTEPLRSFVLSCLERLGNSPRAFVVNSPAPGRGQLAEFHFEQQGVSVWLAVRFMYGQDEETIHIESVSTEFGA